MVKSYEDLKVWQKAMELAREVYRCAKLMPKDERFGLTNQMCRAAVSVPSNVAEGFGRESTKDFLHFLMMARGSLHELRTQLTLSVQLEFLPNADDAFSLIADVSRLLNALITKLKSKLTTTNH